MTSRRLKECVVLGRRVLRAKQKADLFGPALLFQSIRRRLLTRLSPQPRLRRLPPTGQFLRRKYIRGSEWTGESTGGCECASRRRRQQPPSQRGRGPSLHCARCLSGSELGDFVYAVSIAESLAVSP